MKTSHIDPFALRIMYTLTDTFNGRTISRHCTLEAAVRADIRFSRAVRRANGASSYIPTRITLNGDAIDPDLVLDAKARLGWC